MIAIVTGASSGLGAECARQLDRESLRELWLVARDSERLQEVANSLSTPCRILSCDLSNPDEIDRVIVAPLREENPVVRYCVNNAGFGKIGPMHQLDRSDMTTMVDVNCRAVVQLSHSVIPYMERGSALIHTSSIAGFMPLGGFAVYAATKAFVTSFSVALQAELKDRGVHSIALCPGPIETDFSRRAHIGSVRSESVMKKKGDPKKMIAKALRDTKRHRSVSLYGLPYYGIRLLSKIASPYWLAKVSYDRIMKEK